MTLLVCVYTTHINILFYNYYHKVTDILKPNKNMDLFFTKFKSSEWFVVTGHTRR